MVDTPIELYSENDARRTDRNGLLKRTMEEFRSRLGKKGIVVEVFLEERGKRMHHEEGLWIETSIWEDRIQMLVSNRAIYDLSNDAFRGLYANKVLEVIDYAEMGFDQAQKYTEIETLEMFAERHARLDAQAHQIPGFDKTLVPYRSETMDTDLREGKDTLEHVRMYLRQLEMSKLLQTKAVQIRANLEAHL